jgi:sugar O-acyltransferase (sialic acid O-acetyltransferase NeuD family)
LKNLIIYGVSDFSKLMSHYFNTGNKYRIVAYCADNQFISSNNFNGRRVYPLDAIADYFSPKDTEIFVAVGYKSMLSRELMFDKALKSNFNLASMVSEKATIDESASLGLNCIIFPGVQIEPNVRVADNCIIWSSSIICHNSVINAHTFIAAQSVIGGRSIIGERCFLGFNSTVIHDVVVGDDCLVGAKSLVTNSIPIRSKCMGIPAKVTSKIGHQGVCVQ